MSKHEYKTKCRLKILTARNYLQYLFLENGRDGHPPGQSPGRARRHGDALQPFTPRQIGQKSGAVDLGRVLQMERGQVWETEAEIHAREDVVIVRRNDQVEFFHRSPRLRKSRRP